MRPIGMTPVSDEAFRLTGDIDLQTAPELLERLVAHADAIGPSTQLVLDCEPMHFIDSTGLSVLVAVQKKTGRSIVLRNVQPPCRRILEVTHLDEVFVVEPDADAAGSDH